VGRENDLIRLHQQLQESDRAAISAIQGMGGIGKSELALQYAHQQRELNTYPGGIAWLNARENVGLQVVNFAQFCWQLVPPEGDLDDKVRFCWQQWREGETLIILDDVQAYEAIRPYLPPSQSRFKVLLTTRLNLGSSVRKLKLAVLSEAAALELLRSLTSAERIETQLDEAKQLCEWLGYLPLALELVGRYLARKPDLSLTELWNRLQAKRLAAKALKDRAPDMTAPLGVAAAFELSWQDLTPPAQQLAHLLSLFALAEIPWAAVAACWTREAEVLEDLRDEQLTGRYLLTRTQPDTYQLHQLLREFFAAKRLQTDDIGLRQAFAQVMLNVAQHIPQTPTQDLIQALAPAMPHLAEVATHYLTALDPENVIWLFTGLGRFYQGQGTYHLAEPWCQQCVEVARSLLGEAHPDVAASLNNLAGLYESQGRYEEAELLYLEALPIVFNVLGESHPNTQTVWQNFVTFLMQVIQDNRITELSEHPLTQDLIQQIMAGEARENGESES
jgi:tetratricopeptide (TPR) repeat protein